MDVDYKFSMQITLISVGTQDYNSSGHQLKCTT